MANFIKTTFFGFAVSLFILFGCNEESLYQRIGKTQKLTSIVDSTIINAAKDPLLDDYFQMLSVPQAINKRAKMVELLCDLTGGPCKYSGLDMVTAHQNLNISVNEFDKFMGFFTASMAQNGVGETEQQELRDIMLSFKEDVVSQ